MPRPRRNFLPGNVYLVSQQGNKQNPVYVDEQDRETAADFLHTYALRYHVEVLAFAFGEFEGRWLFRPSTRRAISNLMRDMQSAYSRYLNKKYEHRPCCALRRLSGMRACHNGSAAILDSSNWTPRYKVTEVSAEYLPTANDFVAGLRLAQLSVACKTRTPKPAQASQNLVLVRTALRSSLPLAEAFVRFAARQLRL